MVELIVYILVVENVIVVVLIHLYNSIVIYISNYEFICNISSYWKNIN